MSETATILTRRRRSVLMFNRAIFRLRDIKKNIGRVRSLLAGKSFEQIRDDDVALAAFERYLEIVSEASRHVPAAWQAEHAEIPWRNIIDLGNLIRHEYRHVEAQALWAIYKDDPDPLERAIDAMLAARDR